MTMTKSRPKVWADITDEEMIEAVVRACERSRNGVAGSAHVAQILSAPTITQWPDAPPNGVLGMGLIPNFGEGAAPSGAVTRRLKKLVAAGKLRAHPMVRPMGRPTADSYSVIR